MQLVVATASAAPTRAANACSNARTRGPCETQPEAIASATAAPSSPRKYGRVNGTSITPPSRARVSARSARRRARRATSRRAGPGPPRGRPRPRSRAARAPASVSARRRVTPLTARSGPCSTAEVGAHDAQQHLGELEQAGLRAAGDVEDRVGHVALGGEEVRARDVADVDEVHRLRAVAEDQRRLAGRDPLHPAHEDLGVEAVDVHARAVDVEVAQRDVVEPVHRVQAAQQALVEGLRRAVERVVGVRVVLLGGRELLGEAVDRGRRGRDDLADARAPRRPRRRCRCRRRAPRARAAAPRRTG